MGSEMCIRDSPNDAKVNVNNRVTPALTLLPDEVRRYGVTVTERSGTMLEVLAFYDPSEQMDIVEMQNYVATNVVDELKRVPGVGEAQKLGTKDYAMRIWVKPELLKKFNVTTAEIIAAISEQNSQYAVGKMGEQPMDLGNPYVYAIKPEGRLKTVEEFENIIIRAQKDGNFLRVKDVAEVKLGGASYAIASKFNGKEMVAVLINMQNGANALAVV